MPSLPDDYSPSFTDATVEDLTQRELEILRCVTNGLSNRQIVETLSISTNTVKTYIKILNRKIGARSRTHVVIWGVRHGLLAGAVDDDAETRRSDS